MNTPSPFHEGEQRVQSCLGVREDIEPWARQVVRGYLPEQHRDFHTSLPFLVAAARDAQGRPWVTLLTGSEGFVQSPDPEHLSFDVQPLAGDALTNSLTTGSELGLLGIELATRRRNRVNGTVTAQRNGHLLFKVEQSFGNCPQYIQQREWRRVAMPEDPPPARRATLLTAEQMAWIEAADTFFIASGHQGEGDNPAYGMDASHRGGAPGFVHIENNTRLVFPDYAGNNHYNTIGNLVMDPRAGLLFVDFERGGLLQLTGGTQIDWDSDAVARHPGARRLVIFDLEESVELDSALPLRWSATAGSVRSLRLLEKNRESEDVTSFVFAARDGGPLPDYEAGQHLPIELEVAGLPDPVPRTYSLSGAPGIDRYRISVKREHWGLASRLLHDSVEVGAIISARSPAGEFVLSPGRRPVVLLSAGVGITPMISMLHALADEGEQREVWFVHGARDGLHQALVGEARAIVATTRLVRLHIAFSQPREEDRPGQDYNSEGRIDGKLLARLLPELDAEFYLCGPTGFLATLNGDLNARGVPTDRIHAETFGPGG